MQLYCNAGSSLTLTATLGGTTGPAIAVALDASGTATEGTDYTDGSGNIDDITISAGELGTVSLHQQMIVFMMLLQ